MSWIWDLVLCSDNRSEGVHYTLVELESPHVPAYTKGGQPSSRLTGALQQIQDWQRWIDSNRGEAKRLFRSLFFERYNQPSFDYMVIIGKRKVDSDYLHLRNRLSQQMRVRIRSYDWFTSNDFPFQDVAAEAVRPTNRVPAALGHLLADPFAVAYSDPEWRSMVKRRDFGSSHFVSENARTLVETRHRNARYLELERLWSKLSKRSRKLETWFLERLLTACDRG